MKRISFISIILILTLVFSMGAGIVRAESFPERDITFVVPFSAGGGTDTATRKAANLMSDYLGVTIVVENIPGADSILAMEEVLSREKDGYTLMGTSLLTNFMSSVAHEPGFYFHEEFDVLGIWLTDPDAFIVRRDGELDSIYDVFDMLEEEPGRQVTIGVGGGMYSRYAFSAIQMVETLGIEDRAVIVPFPGGADVDAALRGGHIDIGTRGAYYYLDDEDLKYILVAWNERVYEDAPTLEEVTGKEVYLSAPYGLTIAKGVPEDRISVLEEALEKAINSSDWEEWAHETDMLPHTPMTGEVLDNYLDNFYNSLWEQREVFQMGN